MKRSKAVKVLLIFLPLVIGLLSSMISGEAMKIYEDINRPPLSPPSMLFPIVWTILYLLMGIASAIIYSQEDNSDNRALGLVFHFVQLIFNFFWSIIFFNLRNYILALLFLILLWLTVFSMIMNYKKVNRAASIMNIPYLAWLTFAGYLNLMIFVLN